MGKTGSDTNQTSFEIENDLLAEGYKVIAGVDEAGRGALAGPLAVGLVIYRESFISNPSQEILKNIRDSKKLSPSKRIEALELIKEHSEYAAHTFISHRIIDRLNINLATEFAIKKLLKKIPVRPDLLILDGNFSFNLGIPHISIIKGDSKSTSIASASIMAKVKRDKLIEKFDLIYPGYLFKKNKGYGTVEHRKAIQETGPSPIHRKTYEPLRSLLEESNRLF